MFDRSMTDAAISELARTIEFGGQHGHVLEHLPDGRIRTARQRLRTGRGLLLAAIHRRGPRLVSTPHISPGAATTPR